MHHRLIAALAVLAATRSGPAFARPGATAADAVDAVARRYQLAGEVLLAGGDRILLDRGYGTIAPSGGALHKAGERWRLASITKQVTAALIVRYLFQLEISLDHEFVLVNDGVVPGAVTWRQILTHHTRFPNPDSSSPDANRMPSFYEKVAPDLQYCLPKRPEEVLGTTVFSYNNCDYIILGRELELWNRRSFTALAPAGLAMAQPGEVGMPGFIGGKAEPQFQLASFGAAGGLVGTARAVFDFDRSLMTGRLLPPAARDELWKPEGNGSYQALGQWVFPGQLKGCAAPKRIVQRDGEIQGVQTRNFIFPDDDLVVIVFTNRSADDFALGEVWEGKGFVFDLLSAAACP